MGTSIYLEDLTSQQLLRRLSNRAAAVFGSFSHDIGDLSLNAQDRALFRSVLHRVAVTDLWVTRLQFRQFFGTADKGSTIGASIRSHDSLMSTNPSKDREARLYQEAYRQLTDYVAQYTDTASDTTSHAVTHRPVEDSVTG